ncbi:MAG: DUF5681 domain-containing protein [Candidatus Thiodiazotropha lotti]|uniref:DUF5681 domain-containing protein n=1 Tax=Candidatus Thiodiazotropha lotti TaxID=2792787 RepID=A0A9E4K642_9GAMM|nr:DUF5681 domain-containing protein [Candidatus Thiodiazotropha lotti]MCW4203968.1 DUF5681 domain-containing protein [Candidatus Thiodiazotropha lotti]
MAKFKPGQSGNPKGRPKGSRKISKLRAKLEPYADDLIEKAVDLALGGDLQALKLCLERLLPPLRPQAESVKLSALSKAESLSDMGEAILQSIAAGELPPDVGRDLLTAIAAQMQIAEGDELQKRLELLEGMTSDQK